MNLILSEDVLIDLFNIPTHGVLKNVNACYLAHEPRRGGKNDVFVPVDGKQAMSPNFTLLPCALRWISQPGTCSDKESQMVACAFVGDCLPSTRFGLTFSPLLFRFEHLVRRQRPGRYDQVCPGTYRILKSTSSPLHSMQHGSCVSSHILRVKSR